MSEYKPGDILKTHGQSILLTAKEVVVGPEGEFSRWYFKLLSATRRSFRPTSYEISYFLEGSTWDVEAITLGNIKQCPLAGILYV